MNFAGNTSYDTHALRLRWGGRGSYTMALPELDLTDSALSFDLCDLDESRVEKGNYALVDAEVRLTDAGGNTASARVSDFATVYPILPVRTDKLDYVFDTCTYKKAFATVSIPAEAFAPEGEGIDLAHIVEVEFYFDQGGQVAIDNIGVVK